MPLSRPNFQTLVRSLALTVCLTLSGAASSALAQTAPMDFRLKNPEVLGISLRSKVDDALALLRQSSPKLTVKATQAHVRDGDAYLSYDAMLDISLDPKAAGPHVISDELHLNVLPDGSIVGLNRKLRFVEHKQTFADLSQALMNKHGGPVYLLEAEPYKWGEMIWSDQMLPGLRQVGMEFRPVGSALVTNPGSTPYPVCRADMTQYTESDYAPQRLSQTPFHHQASAYPWQRCGVMMSLQVTVDPRLTFYLSQAVIRLGDVGGSPALMKTLPAQIQQHPKTQRTVPADSLPQPARTAPRL